MNGQYLFSTYSLKPRNILLRIKEYFWVIISDAYQNALKKNKVNILCKYLDYWGLSVQPQIYLCWYGKEASYSVATTTIILNEVL